jgi:hypothetical protein
MLNVIEVPARPAACACISADPLYEVGGIDPDYTLCIARLNAAQEVCRPLQNPRGLVGMPIREAEYVAAKLALIPSGSQIV